MSLTQEEQRELAILQNRITVVQAEIDSGASGEELIALQSELYNSRQLEQQLLSAGSDQPEPINPDELYDSFWDLYVRNNPPPGGVITPNYAAEARPVIRQQVIDTVATMPEGDQSAFDDLIESLNDPAEFYQEDLDSELESSLAIIDAAYDDSLGPIPDESFVQMYGTVLVENLAATINFSGSALIKDVIIRVTVKGRVLDTFCAAGVTPEVAAERVYVAADEADFPQGLSIVARTLVFTDATGWDGATPTVEFLPTLHVQIVETLPSNVVTLVYAGELVAPFTYQQSYVLSNGDQASLVDPVHTADETLEQLLEDWASIMLASGHWETVTYTATTITATAPVGVNVSLFSALVENQYQAIEVYVDGTPPDFGPSQFMIELRGDEAVEGQVLWADLDPFGYFTLDLTPGALVGEIATSVAAELDASPYLSTAISNGVDVLITADSGSFTTKDAGIITNNDPFQVLTYIDNGIGGFDVSGYNPAGNEVFVMNIEDTNGLSGTFVVRLTRESTPQTVATDLIDAINAEGEFVAADAGGATATVTATGDTNYILSITAQSLHGSGPLEVTHAGDATDSKLVQFVYSGGPATGDEWTEISVTCGTYGQRIFTHQCAFGQTIEEVATALALLVDADPVLLARASGAYIDVQPAIPTDNLTAATSSVSTTEPRQPLVAWESGAGPGSTEVLFTIDGGPAAGTEELTWAIYVDGSTTAITGTLTPIAADTTAAELATLLADDIGLDASFTAVATGKVVDVSLDVGSAMTNATVELAGVSAPLDMLTSGAGATSTSVTFTVMGGPATGNESVGATLTADGGAVQPFGYAPSTSETASDIATELASDIELSESFSASAVDEVVTVVPAGSTTYITAATASVSGSVLLGALEAESTGGGEYCTSASFSLSGGDADGTETITVSVAVSGEPAMDSVYNPRHLESAESIIATLASEIIIAGGDRISVTFLGGVITVASVEPDDRITTAEITIT